MNHLIGIKKIVPQIQTPPIAKETKIITRFLIKMELHRMGTYELPPITLWRED